MSKKINDYRLWSAELHNAIMQECMIDEHSAIEAKERLPFEGMTEDEMVLCQIQKLENYIGWLKTEKKLRETKKELERLEYEYDEYGTDFVTMFFRELADANSDGQETTEDNKANI